MQEEKNINVNNIHLAKVEKGGGRGKSPIFFCG